MLRLLRWLSMAVLAVSAVAFFALPVVFITAIVAEASEDLIENLFLAWYVSMALCAVSGVIAWALESLIDWLESEVR